MDNKERFGYTDEDASSLVIVRDGQTISAKELAETAKDNK